MKDYYDLFKLCDRDLSLSQLKQNIEVTFSNRNLEPSYSLNFDSSDLERLETYWGHFLSREEIKDAPKTIAQTIKKINSFMKELAHE